VQSNFLDATVLRSPSHGKIRQKIIGRTLRRGNAAGGRGRFHAQRFPLAMFHQSARQHGRAVLFNPLIHQRNDLFAQIGDVSEP
jgi:hypothetical protein